MVRIINAAAVLVLLIGQVLVAQSKNPMKPAVPGTPGDPAWQGVLRMKDGRTFVTDGGLAVDAAFAKPARLPDREIPPKVLESNFSAPHKDECGLSQLQRNATGKTYSTPGGIALSVTYVDFLRRVVPGPVRLRTTDGMSPVVIVSGGQPVGVLMPVKQ